jgi:putative membrane protein
MIWINVGPQAPATNPQPVGIKGKGITTDNVHVQLHRRKVEALHLLLSFVVSTKHYLREEDGLNYPDYLGVLPASFVRTASMASGHYPSKAYSMTSHDGTVSGQTTPDSIRPDATKRVRVKRSKHQLMDPSTPLLCEHRTVDFASEDASFPLPLLYVGYSLTLLTSLKLITYLLSRIAHELSRIIYGFRRDGFLETVGPAGLNAFTQQYEF